MDLELKIKSCFVALDEKLYYFKWDYPLSSIVIQFETRTRTHALSRTHTHTHKPGLDQYIQAV